MNHHPGREAIRKERMNPKLTAVIALVIAVLTAPAVASAHVEVEPSEAPAGKVTDFNLVIPHGCDGAATTSVTVQVPGSSIRGAKAQPVEGWKASNAKGRMKWTGGPLPDHQVQELPFTAKFYGKKGSRVPLKLIQGCEGGKSTPWLQVVPEGAAEPETPAPVVTLASSASAPAAPVADPEGAGEGQPSGTNGEQAATGDVPDSSEEDEGVADGLIIAVFAVVAVALVAGAVYWARRSRD